MEIKAITVEEINEMTTKLTAIRHAPEQFEVYREMEAIARRFDEAGMPGEATIVGSVAAKFLSGYYTNPKSYTKFPDDISCLIRMMTSVSERAVDSKENKMTLDRPVSEESSRAVPAEEVYKTEANLKKENRKKTLKNHPNSLER